MLRGVAVEGLPPRERQVQHLRLELPIKDPEDTVNDHLHEYTICDKAYVREGVVEGSLDED